MRMLGTGRVDAMLLWCMHVADERRVEHGRLECSNVHCDGEQRP